MTLTLWFCSQVLPPHVGPRPKPSSIAYMSASVWTMGAIPRLPGIPSYPLPSHKLTCRSE